jgi:hypothetical protein
MIKLVQIKVISLIDNFFEYWDNVKNLSMRKQIELYPEIYLKDNTYLFEKQKRLYDEDGEDWKIIAEKHVYPGISEKIIHFKKLDKILKQVGVDLTSKITNFFPENYKITFVVYFGLGIGAGYANFYANTPAVLFGVENIVECNWLSYDSLLGLASHEIGHLYHFHLRGVDNEINYNKIKHISKYWLLYEEGFAMRLEEMFLNKNSFHMTDSNEDWLTWCSNNAKNLAKLFLEYINYNKNTNEFFGSWFKISGYSQTGYFLGHRVIKELEKNKSFKDIGLLNDDDLDNILPIILKDFENN